VSKDSATPGTRAEPASNAVSAASRAEAISTALAAAPEPTDHAAMRGYLRTLAGVGLHVLFVDPDTKRPTDFRPRRRRSANRNRWANHTGGGSAEATPTAPKDGGVYQATDDPDTLDRYLTAYVRRYGAGCAVNLAVAVGPSRIVVVDADTAAQVAAFTRSDPDADRTPTVSTPGQRHPDTGEWVHSGGGHWWYLVPEGVDIPENTHALTLGDGDDEARYSALCGARYVLIPPSARPEGQYKATGAAAVLSDALAAEIIEHARRRAERAQRSRDRIIDADDPIAVWGNGITWDEILADTGWVNTGESYSDCGCDIWTAPGLHATERSAVAHEPGCPAFDSPDPPLYCFTDHDREPFETVIAATGRQTVTRLEAYAAIHHENNIGAAMAALDLFDDQVTVDLDPAACGADHAAPYADPAAEGADHAGVVADAAAAALADLRAVMTANVDLFDDSPVLRHVMEFADSRGAERFGTLVGVCMHAVEAIPPCVVLPPIVRGPGSLNLFLAAVGAPGGGKGAIDDSSRLAVRFRSRGTVVANLDMIKLGTGEGINRTYATARRDRLTGVSVVRQHADRALFGSPDIDTWAALIARKGATLVPEILGAFMGEPLGFANAGDETRVLLPSHSYRMCLSVGVQPENGSILLDGQASGTPQRFLWMPVRPGVARRQRQKGDAAMTALIADLPDFGMGRLPRPPQGPDEGGPYAADFAGAGMIAAPLVTLDVAWSIAEQIIAADAAKDLDPLGRTGDTLAGHRLFMQEKLAAALGFLHGEAGVIEENWQRAARVLAVSSAMTTLALALADASAGREAVRQGKLYGARQVAADTVRDSAKVRDVAGKLYARIGDHWTTVNATAFIARGKHEFIEAAWRLLIPGQVEVADYSPTPGKMTRRYRRVPSS